MSAFDEWYEQDGKQGQGAWIRHGFKDDMRAAFNAGMERAAVIAENHRIHKTGMSVSEAIRAEIKGQGTDND